MFIIFKQKVFYYWCFCFCLYYLASLKNLQQQKISNKIVMVFFVFFYFLIYHFALKCIIFSTLLYIVTIKLNYIPLQLIVN